MAKKAPKKTKIKLTDDQRKQLTKILGAKLASRIQTIDVELIAGFVKVEAHPN